MRMSEKCRNNNSDNPLTSHRTDEGKNCVVLLIHYLICTLRHPVSEAKTPSSNSVNSLVH